MTALELKNYFRATLLAQRNINQEFLVLDAIVDFITQAITSGIPDWTNALTFQLDGTDAGSFCVWPDTSGNIRFWKTKTDDNVGNEPPTNPATTENTHWIEVSPGAGSAIKEWMVGVYGDGLIIVYHNHSILGPGLYLLLDPVRPFDSTNIETEITAGDWVRIGGSGSGMVIAETYATIAALLADQANQDEGKWYLVQDASADTTVDAGWAIYQYLGTTVGDLTDYLKVAEQESLDVVINDASETAKGIVEEATDGETAAGTAVGGTGAKLFVTPAKLLTWWAAIKAAAQTITAKWTFNDVAITNQIEATKKVGLYIDTDGTVKKVAEGVYNSTNKSWTFTGVDDSGSTVFYEWVNQSLQRILAIYNDQHVEVGGSTSYIKVGSTVASGDAKLEFLDNKALAYILGTSGQNFIEFVSTTGAHKIRLKVDLEHDNNGSVYIQVHYETTTSSTASAVTTIGAFPLTSGKIANIWSSWLVTETGVITGGGIVEHTLKNLIGTTSEIGAANAPTPRRSAGDFTFDINADDANDTIDFDFTNSTAPNNKAYKVNIHAEIHITNILT